MTDGPEYDSSFYEDNQERTKYSPKSIFETLLSIMKVDSLCDVGGGIGLWTKGFIDLKGDEANLDRIVCLDGSYVNEEQLLIPKNCFITTDLEKPLPAFDEKFDLAMSLEVAEHLSPERSDSFVEDLTKLSDVVLFSAAVPGQGGTHHVNEQHMCYWVEKFGTHGYEPFDIIRPVIQNDRRIPYWYRQNTIVFVKKDAKINDSFKKTVNKPLIHTVSDELYDIILGFKNSFEEEKNGLYKKIESLDEEKRQVEEELNFIKSGLLFKPYMWLKTNIFSKLKF